MYLDNHATTPLDPRVLDAMLPFLREDFGNASSTDHTFGVTAATAVEEARESVAKLIGANPDEIVFTSGATESDNLAIGGFIEARGERDLHVITSTIEHRAVLDSVGRLQRSGIQVSYVPVDKRARVSVETLRDTITDKTALVSIMLANNEVGTLQRLAELSKEVHNRGAFFHTDAAQAVGHVPVDVDEMGVDLMSISAHKVNGPKGVGALYIRRRGGRIRLSPQLLGGGQERGLRSGTLNVPGIVGMGEALSLARSDLRQESNRLTRLRDKLESAIAALGEVEVNGDRSARLPHNLNIRIVGVDGKALIGACAKEVAFSASSACSSRVVEPSHVLLALGYSPEQAHQCVRFGLGRFTTEEDIEHASSVVTDSIRFLRKLS
ncbi:MAG: cysteine desulfurase [Nitrososphaerota archaeon]|nr:cysteine desulfurase [Nitrososphaerota archaeon]